MFVSRALLAWKSMTLQTNLEVSKAVTDFLRQLFAAPSQAVTSRSQLDRTEKITRE